MILQRNYLPCWPLLLFFTVLMAYACKETYDPEIETQEPVIVVDALITNEPGPYEVKLNLSVAYNSTQSYPAITNATVYVIDQNNHIYYFKEDRPGYYYSAKADFRGEPGSTYTLYILTVNGQTIVSKPQTMPMDVRIDSVYGVIDEKEYIYTSGGVYSVKKAKGVQTFADFSTKTLAEARIRFSATLVVGYTMIDKSTQPYPSIVYAWRKENPLKSFNLTPEGTFVNQQQIKQYDICFFPVKESLYQISVTETITNWFLQVKPYALTQDASRFYKALNDQLAANNQLFDPIAAQVQGNLSCNNEPQTKVFGFFEVSACSKKSFWVKPLLGDNLAVFASAVDVDSIPEHGKSIQEPPYFWRF